MHFAAFKGNINAIEVLINNGGNIHQKNGFGLNMLHVSAQGD
jgi:ankyrin repeat protein